MITNVTRNSEVLLGTGQKVQGGGGGGPEQKGGGSPCFQPF